MTDPVLPPVPDLLDQFDDLIDDDPAQLAPETDNGPRPDDGDQDLVSQAMADLDLLDRGDWL